MVTRDLNTLVDMFGIETNFVDAWGKSTTISESSQIKLLNALGGEVGDGQSFESSVENSINNKIEQSWEKTLPPVMVIRTNEPFTLPINVSIIHANEVVTVEVIDEHGTIQSFSITPVEGELVDVSQHLETEQHRYLVNLAEHIDSVLSEGYYNVSVSIHNTISTMKLIVAPLRCYLPTDSDLDKKPWGFSVQLYSLRSANNWGIGDFSDLQALVVKTASWGVDFIGLNPIHALFPSSPDSCSPYGPSSRKWINYLYLDVEQLPCFDEPDVQTLVSTPEFQQRLNKARALEYIDYSEVADLKFSVLHVLYAAYYKKYLSKNTKQNKAFKTFVSDGGESLDMQAVYDALQQNFKDENKPYTGWHVFPDAFSEYSKPAVEEFKKCNAKQIKFYKFLQWQAYMQLEEVQNKAIKAGMKIGLYRDLAVGVSEGSAEVWGNKGLYCVNASVGAPPDVLGPLGQNWGLPPMHPTVLYEQGYQAIIDLFQPNMAASGALRIDHVMALLRLWWVVKGDDATEGGYVYYPVDDLLGILALESQRNQSIVIGEDLGTVPNEIRIKLADNGIFSYKVFFFEQAPDGGFFSPTHYSTQSMATLTTHDMPTLIGYWHCLDLELGKQLGIYSDEAILANLYTQRHKQKQAILNSLHGHNSTDESIGSNVDSQAMTEELNIGMHLHMARGSSALLSFQLEDWLQMDKPVNIPGTFKEYPNWKRKLSHNIEDIFDQQKLITLANNISQARQNNKESV